MENAIAVQNLGAYNRGELRYKWLELPATEEEITDTINEVLNTDYRGDEEIHLADFNDPTGLLHNFFSEYSSISEINDFVQLLEDCHLDNETLAAIASTFTTKDDFVQVVLEEEGYILFHDVKNNGDLGERLVFDLGLLGLTNEEMKKVKFYLDYDSIGYEAQMENWIIDKKTRIAFKIIR